MTPQEKKERIDYLWGKIRSYVIAGHFAIKVRRELVHNHLAEFMM